MKSLELICCALIAGVVFATTHIANIWVFSNLSISSHIAWVYVPAFLRVANVIVLGSVWGAVGTFIGGLLLIWIQGSNWLMELPNDLISSIAGSLGLGLFVFTSNREFNMYRLWHWIQLTLYCSLISVCLHHLYWFSQDQSQIIEPTQFAVMMFGDVMGTVLGAWLLRTAAKALKLRKSVQQD